MARASLVFGVVLVLMLAFMPAANASGVSSSKDVLLSCAGKARAQTFSGTQWELADLDQPSTKTIDVEGTAVELTPVVVLGATYVKITTGGQDDEVVASWNTGGTRTMDNGIEITCYFQHDD